MPLVLFLAVSAGRYHDPRPDKRTIACLHYIPIHSFAQGDGDGGGDDHSRFKIISFEVCVSRQKCSTGIAVAGQMVLQGHRTTETSVDSKYRTMSVISNGRKRGGREGGIVSECKMHMMDVERM